jgi:hypothetical protein
MLFNEERSHLAADQSKNFPQSLTYNYYWIPRLVIVVIWPKCCAAFFLLLFFFFPSSAIVQQAQRSADGERVVYTTKVAKRHSVDLIVVWYALSNE